MVKFKAQAGMILGTKNTLSSQIRLIHCNLHRTRNSARPTHL